MASLLSVNGKLELMNLIPSEKADRSTGYEPVDIGKPLVIRYLNFFIKYPKNERGDNEIMISTFVKTAEEKAGAAEAINYFNPETRWGNDDIYELNDFGGQHYGHELCYYNKSYLGESVRLTTRIVELDKVDKNLIKAIQSGVSTVAGLPTFASFVPYAAIANVGIGAIGKIVNVFNKDDKVLRHDIDLYFNRNHARRLQSGRVLCVPKRPDTDFIEKYQLDNTNRLVSIADGTPYTASSYYVLQINSEKNKLYEDFDHFQRAAELIAMTNRGGRPEEFVEAVSSSLKAYQDVESIREIESLSVDASSEESVKRINALYKRMSPDVQRLYQGRVKELTQPAKEAG